ncbi:hypothetical protein DVJ83_18390 (plasmid) [Deinococcus wulumuqiensis]|uniref:Uncharacterized protein n=1 Tax=Deinococcus wulumuqiensis TaxID=980427 RepID=A0A345IMY2_9DEIO|nr:hypothetical protein DVJ83_18390 [Deinococcus wulumuqiensis]
MRPDSTATRSILCPARLNSLASLCFAALQVGQKRSAFPVKCSISAASAGF